jgi:hypothetical protein
VVAAKAQQRLALEAELKKAPELRPGGSYHGRPADFAMRKFAYYMCSKCSQPYFGGLRSCDLEQEELRDVQQDEMVCGGCSVIGVEVPAQPSAPPAFPSNPPVCVSHGLICAGVPWLRQSCPKHGLEAIEYKCKFCCSVASWFCWGTTHFCDSCHRKQVGPILCSTRCAQP